MSLRSFASVDFLLFQKIENSNRTVVETNGDEMAFNSADVEAHDAHVCFEDET